MRFCLVFTRSSYSLPQIFQEARNRRSEISSPPRFLRPRPLCWLSAAAAGPSETCFPIEPGEYRFRTYICKLVGRPRVCASEHEQERRLRSIEFSISWIPFAHSGHPATGRWRFPRRVQLHSAPLRHSSNFSIQSFWVRKSETQSQARSCWAMPRRHSETLQSGKRCAGL